MLDLLRILLRWRRPVLAWSLAAAVIAGVVAFRLTPRYYSQASILPPAENAAFGGLSALMQQYQIPIPGGINTPFLPTLYASIVSSRRMGARILDEFDLRPVFKAETEEDALEMLRQRTTLKYTDESILLVGYEDTSAQRAAEIVNAYVKHLDTFIQEINASRAGDTRRFVESQVERCKKDLARAEEALRDFQRVHRAFQIDAQTEGALEIASELQARIEAAQVELDVLRKYARPNANEVRRKELELEALRDRFKTLFGELPGRAAAPGDSLAVASERLFPGFDEVPDLALTYMRLLRGVKVQTALYTMLLQQLEQARIEEQKNTRVLSVLDWAVPGEVPVYPKKMRMIVVATLAAFLWVMLIAVAVEKLRERREDAAEAARLAALRREWNRMPGWVRSLERLVVK